MYYAELRWILNSIPPPKYRVIGYDLIIQHKSTKCTFSKLIIYHVFFLIYRNLSSWLIQKCVAAFTVLRHGLLVPFILKDMYVGVSCFFFPLNVLLYHIVALLLYSFSFIFLCWYICSASWALAYFMFFVPCILM